MFSLNTNRKSGIELLKIIALFGIVLCHTYTAFANAIDYTNNSIFFDTNTFSVIEYFAFQIIITLGYLGNNIFFVCSAWFLVDNKTNKKEKIISMILNAFILSIIFLAIYYLAGFELNKDNIIQSILPISKEVYWYITCYIIFYAIYPLLNIIINSISKKQLFTLTFVMFFLYYVYVYFFNIGTFFVSKLVVFVVAYFVVAYLKKYKMNYCDNAKKNVITLLISSGIFYAMIFINFAITPISIKWHEMYNPFFLIMAISLLNIFRKANIKNGFINTISALSLYIYMAHANPLFMNNTLNYLTSYVMSLFGVKFIVIKVVAFSLLLFIFASIVSMVYYLIFNNVIGIISIKIKDFLSKIRDSLYNVSGD